MKLSMLCINSILKDWIANLYPKDSNGSRTSENVRIVTASVHK